MSEKVVSLKAKLRKVTVRYLDHDAMRDMTLASRSRRYATEPDLLIVETESGGFVEWPLEVVLMVTDDPA